MINKIKYWLSRFLYGRYGVDKLNYAIFMVIIALMIINMFANQFVIYLFTLIFIAIYFFRPLSKNYSARRKENQWFLNLAKPFKRIKAKKTQQKQNPNHKIYECPKCHQFVRIPKGKGKVEITCPKCKNIFEKRT